MAGKVPSPPRGNACPGRPGFPARDLALVPLSLVIFAHPRRSSYVRRSPRPDCAPCRHRRAAHGSRKLAAPHRPAGAARWGSAPAARSLGIIEPCSSTDLTRWRRCCIFGSVCLDSRFSPVPVPENPTTEHGSRLPPDIVARFVPSFPVRDGRVRPLPDLSGCLVPDRYTPEPRPVRP